MIRPMRITNSPLQKSLLWLFMLFLLASCGTLNSSTANTSPNLDMSATSSAAPVQAAPLSSDIVATLPKELQDIHRRGELRIAMYGQDRFPFFYVDDNGELTGSDVLLAQDIAYKFGVKAVFLRTATSFDEVANQVATGEADIALSKLSITLKRAQHVLFSEPYLTLHQSLLINRLQLARLGKSTTNAVEQIQQHGSTIGTITGTSYREFAEILFSSSEISSFATSQNLLDSVSKGEIVAALYDEFEFAKYLKQNPGSALTLQYIVLDDYVDPLAIAVSPNHPLLLSWINAYLQLNRPFINQLLHKFDIQN
ncbi:MAG: ABC transporter substrate-binding protein [Candidatus Cohnella colombiensis]|uniref:ABC transporter substrate-binding protein n=1 Tax=Candidatus Cohnella colombiensis TaxID=3121368 RepID=A0AA95EWE0_9BACL|nr:MAG: ABC transporter substrate-binding protein [Cohnella sp.]